MTFVLESLLPFPGFERTTPINAHTQTNKQNYPKGRVLVMSLRICLYGIWYCQNAPIHCNAL